MADLVGAYIEVNGFRNAVVRLTNQSDGTGETSIKKVDATATGPLGVSMGGRTFYPGANLRLVQVYYDLSDMEVQLQWEGSPSNADLLDLGPATSGIIDFRENGGLRVPSGLAGATGSILLTTYKAQPASNYTIILYLKKNFVT